MSFSCMDTLRNISWNYMKVCLHYFNCCSLFFKLKNKQTKKSGWLIHLFHLWWFLFYRTDEPIRCWVFLNLVVDNMMKENLQAQWAHEHDCFSGREVDLFEWSKLKAELLKLCIPPGPRCFPESVAASSSKRSCQRDLLNWHLSWWWHGSIHQLCIQSVLI